MLPTVVRLSFSSVIGALLLLGEAVPALLGAEADILQERLDEQQRQIDALTEKVDEVTARAEEQERELDELREQRDPDRQGWTERVWIGGEGAIGFYQTGSKGEFPNGEFRPDDTRLFVEAQVWRNVFLFSELNLVTRENPDEFFELGQLYVDFENVSGLWGADDWVNLRFGRMYVPFGEEYSVRDPIPNPLISHSLSDVWGVDEGIAAFGHHGKFHYVVAIQNGGHAILRDYHPDKSLAGRIGYAPLRWLSFSFSAMRTGKLDAGRDDDFISELWFGNGFIRSLGDPATTETFQADLFELDVEGRWRSGHLKAAGGVVRYRDDDSAANNEREAYYYYLEGKQDLSGSFYTAARFSQIYASDGFLIVGHGDRGDFFFDPGAPLTRDLWRLSLGLGYRFSADLIAKIEVAREDGRFLDGRRRRGHDFAGAQLAFQF